MKEFVETSWWIVEDHLELPVAKGDVYSIVRDPEKVQEKIDRANERNSGASFKAVKKTVKQEEIS